MGIIILNENWKKGHNGYNGHNGHNGQNGQKYINWPFKKNRKKEEKERRGGYLSIYQL